MSATYTGTQRAPDTAFFTHPDNIVLEVLYRHINDAETKGVGNKFDQSRTPARDEAALKLLANLNDPKSPRFEPTVFCSWDHEVNNLQSPQTVREAILQRYVKWARTVARHQTDVVFVSHIILYLITALPSAMYLFHDFHVIHGILHTIYIGWCFGSFTLMMHNHIHNRGILSRDYATFDWIFPYILEPLMGHTWDSYYYHHVKAHHVEGNGPEDISSTIRYQRDSVLDFLHYEFRFLFLCWFDLPRYFISKGQYNLALRVACTELSSYGAMYFLARWNFKPTLFVLLLPFAILRLGLMIGNWGQHALVDDVDPDSDFRSSITLIDVPSNRFCFNDGYHTSHHLNPLRHWRDHPYAFLTAKDRYSKEGALVFQNIDYLEITYRLLTKNYMHLARQLVPIGSQVGKSQEELAAMLRLKTRKFSEKEIASKFKK